MNDPPTLEPVRLEDVLITVELARRPSGPVDLVAENRALVELADALVENGRTALQRLLELVLSTCGAESAGISVLETDGDPARFRWLAVAGVWAGSLQDAVMPESSIGGALLNRGEPALLRSPELCFPTLRTVAPPATEALVVPFRVSGHAVGMVWAFTHRIDARFSAEDARRLNAFSHFAAAAYADVDRRRTSAGSPEKQPAALPAESAFIAREENERTGRALRESEQRLRLILESAKDYAIFTLDLDGCVVSWNSGAAAIFGHSHAEILGQSGDILFLPEDRAQGVPKMETEKAARKDRAENERWHIRKDGSRFFGVGLTQPLRDEAGAVVGFVKIMRDLTQRQLDAEALRESEARHTFLVALNDSLERSSDAALIEEAGTRLLARHLGVARAYYCAVDEETGGLEISRDYAANGLRSVAGLYSLADFQSLFDELRTGRPFVAADVATDPWLPKRERQNILALGHRAFVAAPLFKNSRFVAVLTVVATSVREWVQADIGLVADTAARTWDAVERARTEAKLREAEERYLAIFNSIDQGFCTLEVAFDENQKPFDYRFLEVSPSFERQTGIKNAAGRWMREIAPEQDQHWYDFYGKVALTGEPIRFESSSTPLGRSWSVYAFRIQDPGLRRVAVSFFDITERKQAEEALRASEDRLRTLADSVPQVIWTNSPEGVANYFNQRWYEYTGLTFEQSAGPGWQAVVHPDDALSSVEKWRKALAAKETFDTEYRLRRADGNYRWFIGRNVPLRDLEGRVASWFGTATDIHDLKEAEDAVHEREEQFRRAIEDAPVPMIMHAEDGQALQISRTWTELTGYTAEDIPNFEAWLTRAYGDGGDAVRDHMKALFPRETSVGQAEFEILTRSGERRYWVFRASTPGMLRDGRRFAVGMAIDITDRRRAEEAFATSQEQLRLIVESAYDHAILSMDRERQVTSWNAGAEKVTGYGREEMIGHRADRIFTEEDRATGAPQREADTALHKGRAEDERWHVRKNGSRFWGSGAMLPMRSQPDGQVTGFVKIFRDDTERREAREKLLLALEETRRAREEAEAAGSAKDHFLAVLSHELRTPLTPVLMAAQVLGRRKDLPDTVREALEMIRTNVQLEAHLIDDLLDITRIARGKMEIIRKPVDMHAIIQQAVEISQPDFIGKQQTLTVVLEAPEHQFHGDATRLKQVVWNLLKNASKFTPEGGVIKVCTYNRSGRLFLSVKDTGIGIEPEAMTRIFDPFAQANVGITREFGGLGLGLSISKAAVRAHGGELHAESGGRGQGANLVAALPLTTLPH